jgi:acyl-CoA reductase-like NAD-dependent aldehyde dehydrogenase
VRAVVLDGEELAAMANEDDRRAVDLDRDELEVGGIIVNDVPTWRTDPMPYGGVKESGLGREGLRSSIEDMTEPRLLAFARGS